MTDWALITGASGGLGAALAREAAQQGYGCILSARNEAALTRLAAEIEARGAPAKVLRADLAEEGAAQALWQAAGAIAPISLLINNAGLGQHGRIQDAGLWPQDKATLAVNVTAAADLMKCAAVDMAKRGKGRILNVASSAAFMPGPMMGRYHASKVFLLSLSEAAAEDLRGTGVTVTALCPGPTDTGFFDAGNVNGALALKLMPKASAEAVAKAGLKAALKGKRLVIPGVLYKLVALSMRVTPRLLQAKIAALYWRK